MIQSTDYIFGLRAVMEAIEAGRDIDRVYIKKDLDGDLADQLTDMIRANGIVSKRVLRWSASTRSPARTIRAWWPYCRL